MRRRADPPQRSWTPRPAFAVADTPVATPRCMPRSERTPDQSSAQWANDARSVGEGRNRRPAVLTRRKQSISRRDSRSRKSMGQRHRRRGARQRAAAEPASREGRRPSLSDCFTLLGLQSRRPCRGLSEARVRPTAPEPSMTRQFESRGSARQANVTDRRRGRHAPPETKDALPVLRLVDDAVPGSVKETS